MPRKTFPRRDQAHRVVADGILARHAQLTGQPIVLPVPIELIIEKTYGLAISWDVIEEPPRAKILGALHPADKRIVLNERHSQMFDRWLGPERFTLAHELAHWVYDADDPNQLALDLEDPPARGSATTGSRMGSPTMPASESSTPTSWRRTCSCLSTWCVRGASTPSWPTSGPPRLIGASHSRP